MKFFENGKVFEKNATTSKNHPFLKIGNRYVYAVYDIRNGWHHIFFDGKNLEEIQKKEMPFEDKEYIKIALAKKYEEVYSRSKNVFKRPEKRDIEIGAKVAIGNLMDCTILDKDDVSYYVRINDNHKNTVRYNVVHWNHVHIYNPNQEAFEMPVNDIFYSNTTISDLLNKMFYFGCDMNPSYQRGNVWTVEQEEKLIDSIFKKINIGAFVFAVKDWENGKEAIDDMYEIVDGKQRLTAILHFVEGKIKYNGLYFHEMHRFNQYAFEESQVMVGELNFRKKGYNRNEVLENFIRLNECGSSMNPNIIQNAKKLKQESCNK